MENSLQLILQIVDKKHDSSNGSCGTFLNEIIEKTKIQSSELNLLIKTLTLQKKILIRKGIHGNMIFSTKKPKTIWIPKKKKSVQIFQE